MQHERGENFPLGSTEAESARQERRSDLCIQQGLLLQRTRIAFGNSGDYKALPGSQ